MDTLEKSSTRPSLYGTLENWRTSLAVNNTTSLREMYSTKPITMHMTYPAAEPMKWPRVIRSAYATIWNGKSTRVIIKAPRGGGKSKLLGTVGFDLWYLKKRKVVNMAGSAAQATIVYNYFKDYCDIDASVMSSVAGKPKAIMTTAEEGHYFSSVTASSKQVRGKHPDALISDETCETADDLVHAALPMVDSSSNPLVVMASTFHKIYGIFQETWDNAEERGYTRIQWDIFDVCKEFPADYWENGVLPDGTRVADISGIEKVKEYAKGRTGDPEGWVPVSNVVQAWRERPTDDWFEVEYMGSRPSAAGLVLKPEDIDRAWFDIATERRYSYMRGATCVLGVDWGFSSMTSVVELMRCADSVVAMLDNQNFHQVSSEDIIKAIVKRVREHGIRYIYADSAGKFENVALQNALVKAQLPCVVVEVVFSQEKEGMLGNLRAHFEQGKFKFPNKVPRTDAKNVTTYVSNLTAYWQYKRYRYQDGTDKPVKKDDHVPDATMCALQHFILGQFARTLPVQQSDTVPKPVKEIESTAQPAAKPITAGIMKKQF